MTNLNQDNITIEFNQIANIVSSQSTPIGESTGFSKTISASQIHNVIYRKAKNTSTLVKFEGLPIRDEISGSNCIIRGNTNPAFSDGVSGRALRMRPTSGVDVPVYFNSRSRFSLGFWLRSIWLPPVLSLESNQLNYYRIPIINSSNISLNLTTSIYEASTGFCIFEESIENGKNQLYIFLDGQSGPVLLRSNKEYSTGDFHHFYIAYDGASSNLILYIDGKRVETTMVIGSQIPQLISIDNLTPRTLRINDSAPGFSGLIRNNFGTIDELYFCNKYQGDSELVARHINFGSEFVAFSDLFNQDQVTMMFGFNDPSSLDLQAVFSNGTNVYAGRSDGRLFKGDRLLWQSRRDFSNREEINFVRTKLLSNESSVTVNNGSLRINQASVRL